MSVCHFFPSWLIQGFGFSHIADVAFSACILLLCFSILWEMFGFCYVALCFMMLNWEVVLLQDLMGNNPRQNIQAWFDRKSQPSDELHFLHLGRKWTHREANRAMPGLHLAPLMCGWSSCCLCWHGQLNLLWNSRKHSRYGASSSEYALLA